MQACTGVKCPLWKSSMLDKDHEVIDHAFNQHGSLAASAQISSLLGHREDSSAGAAEHAGVQAAQFHHAAAAMKVSSCACRPRQAA